MLIEENTELTRAIKEALLVLPWVHPRLVWMPVRR
jgi:hypothetical protein